MKRTDAEQERQAFERDAEPMGFDLTRHECAAPEPWSEYKDADTGHRWGGWLARAASMQAESPADPSFVQVHIDEYDKLGCCRRLLEIIAAGDSADPVKDANDELVAHGFWTKRAPAAQQPTPPVAQQVKAPKGAEPRVFGVFNRHSKGDDFMLWAENVPEGEYMLVRLADVIAAPAQAGAKESTPKSLLRAPLKSGERLVCYCPPGICQAPKGFSGPCNREPAP